MKKYFFNKIALILLIASVIFTISTASAYATDTAYEKYIVDDSKSSNYGITAEYYDDSCEYIASSKISEDECFGGFTDNCIKEIYHIEMVYTNYEVNDLEYDLGSTIKLSIPYAESGLYVLSVCDNYAYDTNAEYIDGKYVFETGKMGDFIISSKTIPDNQLVGEQEIELVEQTMVDEQTNIKVSGKLPKDSKMYTSISFVDFESLSDRYDFPYYFADDFGQPDFASFYYKNSYNTNKESTESVVYDIDWIKENEWASALLQVNIVFVKNFEVLDFESEMTVTLPFDYRQALTELCKDSNATVFQLDYKLNNLKGVEVTPAEDTDGGSFEYKINTAGKFFVGNNDLINTFAGFYSYNLEDLDTGDIDVINVKREAETIIKAANNSRNIAVIVLIATNIIWIAIVLALVINIKRKNQ